MHIFHLADHMGYGGIIPHGMTTYLMVVLPQLRSLGHRVTACFLRDSHCYGELLEKQGVETHFLGLKKYDPRLVSWVARKLRQLKPDVVHATQICSTAVARMLQPTHRKRGLVVHIHNFDQLPPGMRWINHHVLPQADATVCVSKAMARAAMDDYGLDPERTSVLHNPFDTDTFLDAEDYSHELRASFGLARDTPLIACVSRFHVDRCVDRLVRVMPAVLREVPNAVAVLVGDGPLRTEFETLAQQLGVAAHVRFAGFRKDVGTIVRQCELLCVTRPDEPFGYTALEAFALRKPVVGISGGGLPEIVHHGHTGLLAPVGDDDCYARHIVTLLKDPAQRARMGRAAFRSLGNYSPDVHVQKLVSVYETAMAANH